MRIASCDAPISIENTATGSLRSSATCSPMFSASAVLPMLGRPATTITRSPGCSPDVILVEIGEAGGHAGDVGRIVAVVERLDALDDLRQQRADLLEVLLPARALLGDVQDLRFGLVEDCVALRPSGLNAESAISPAVAASWRRIERSRTICA